MAQIDVTPYYDNTTMQAYYNNNNVLTAYYIRPIEGYVLHDNQFDTHVIDENTLEETGEIILGYTRAVISVGYNYDFEANPRELYAVPESSISGDQIYGNGHVII